MTTHVCVCLECLSFFVRGCFLCPSKQIDWYLACRSVVVQTVLDISRLHHRLALPATGERALEAVFWLQQGFRLRPFIRLFFDVTAAPEWTDDIRFSGDHHNPQRISSRSSNWDDWDQCVNAYFFLFLCICFVNKLKDDYICICVCLDCPSFFLCGFFLCSSKQTDWYLAWRSVVVQTVLNISWDWPRTGVTPTQIYFAPHGLRQQYLRSLWSWVPWEGCCVSCKTIPNTVWLYAIWNDMCVRGEQQQERNVCDRSTIKD